jgi:hypothetical protein
MKVSAKFALELDASDYVEAAEHQRRLEVFLDALRELYPGAALRVSQGRDAPRRREPAAEVERPVRAPSRRVARYQEY